MAKDTFNDDCPGCKPVLVDPKTMKLVPLTDPAMRAVTRAWGKTTRAEREAFHRFTCQNSRRREDLETVARIQSAMQYEMAD